MADERRRLRVERALQAFEQGLIANRLDPEVVGEEIARGINDLYIRATESIRPGRFLWDTREKDSGDTDDELIGSVGNASTEAEAVLKDVHANTNRRTTKQEDTQSSELLTQVDTEPEYLSPDPETKKRKRSDMDDDYVFENMNSDDDDDDLLSEDDDINRQLQEQLTDMQDAVSDGKDSQKRVHTEPDFMDVDEDGDVSDGGSSSSVHAGKPVLDERFVLVNGRAMTVWDFLGPEWSSMIRALDSVDPIEQPPYCATELRPWQLTGAAKLAHLAKSPHGGAILGDEEGLGKTLTTLTALIQDIMEDDRDGYLGFNLIVTTKTRVRQWMDEIKFHFGEEIAAKSFFLDDPNMTANELLDRGYWFVLCTYQFVVSRWRAWNNNLMLGDLISHIGYHATVKKIPPHLLPNLSRRHISALYSTVYQLLNVPIRCLVLDEAQHVKNIDTATNQAVGALYYRHIFMLSSTFISKRWHDVFCLVALLRHHPWRSKDDFMRSFGHRLISGGYGHPSVSKRNRLVKFLQAITVSRPAASMELKGLTRETIDFMLSEDEEKAVAVMTEEFFGMFRKRGTGITLDDIISNDKNPAAMYFATRAQQHCANSCIIATVPNSAEAIVRGRTRKLIDQLQHEKAKGLAAKDLAEVTAGMANHLCATIGRSFNESTIPSNPAESADGDDDSSKTIKVEPEDNDALGQTEHNLSVQAAGDRAGWLEKVRKMTDMEIHSSKVKAIIKLLHRVTAELPDRKIVVFSKMLKFLDVLHESVHCDETLSIREVDVLRFDGTLDAQERTQVNQNFADPASRNMIMITVAAGARRPNMNLTTASVIIQCEPWWSYADQQQAYSQCWQMGQTKDVRVYEMRGATSMIDFVIANIRDRKPIVNQEIQEIMRGLRRKDEDELIIPKQYKGGIGEH